MGVHPVNDVLDVSLSGGISVGFCVFVVVVVLNRLYILM